MGLNWAAALDNFSKGMGQIAQVKYSEFMRKDEAKRREAEREIDFKRQQNLARFNVDAQKEIQQMGFTHAEKIENARIGRETLRDKQQSDFQMKSLSNQELQMRSSAASDAAQAARSAAQLKMLEDQAGYAKADRELQQQLSVYRIPMEAAQAQLDSLMKNRTELIKQGADTSAIDAQIMTEKQTISNAVDGQVGFMIQSGHIKMDPDAKARYDSLEGQGVSRLQMLQRAMNPVLEADPASADPAAAGQDEFLPTGGNGRAADGSFLDPSMRGVGGTVIPAQNAPPPAMPKFAVPPGLRVPSSEPAQDYTVGGMDASGNAVVGGLGEAGKQVISAGDEYNLTSGASMAAGDAALAGGGSTRDIGASVSVAMRNLSPVAQKEVSSAKSAADLSPTTIDELKAKNYNPDTLIGYLRRNG